MVVTTQKQIEALVSGVLNEWGYDHLVGYSPNDKGEDHMPTILFALEPYNSTRVKPVGTIIQQLLLDTLPVGVRLVVRFWYDQGVFYLSGP
jgi:hypothetical protein